MILRIFAILLCLTGMGFAQTSVNPEISAIADFQLYTHNDESRPEEAELLNFAYPVFELNVGGYLNPYVRGDAVIGWHTDHNAEIEEVYATVERGLPLDTGLRVGKYLLEFGRLNPVHPHAYSFISRPLPHEKFFGEEGLADIAIRPSFLLPTGNAYTEVMVGLLKGDALSGHHHDHEGEEETHEGHEEHRKGLGFFGRITSSFALSQASEFSLGMSALNAVYEVHEHDEDVDQLRAWLIGGDIKYKYRPDRNTALQIEVEGIVRKSGQAEQSDDLTSYGAYGYIDYRFRQKYNIGGIFEYIRIKELHEHEGEEPEVHESDIRRTGLFVGWAPIEETSLVRLAGHYTKPEEEEGFWELKVQLVIGLGPHKPHNF